MDKTKHEEIADAWVECNKAWQERDGHLETIRETFRVLDARGQAPDDNAPLSVNVRRVLDVLDRVTAERDALQKRFKDAPRRRFRADSTEAPQRMAWFALVRLEAGE